MTVDNFLEISYHCKQFGAYTFNCFYAYVKTFFLYFPWKIKSVAQIICIVLPDHFSLWNQYLIKVLDLRNAASEYKGDERAGEGSH